MRVTEEDLELARQLLNEAEAALEQGRTAFAYRAVQRARELYRDVRTQLGLQNIDEAARILDVTDVQTITLRGRDRK